MQSDHSVDFVATSNVNDPILTPKPTEYDVHVYQTPSERSPFPSKNNFLIVRQPGLLKTLSSMMTSRFSSSSPSVFDTHCMSCSAMERSTLK